MLSGPEAAEPLIVRPCLAELFRTCVYPPSLPLHIKKVLVEPQDHNRGKEASETEWSSGDETRRAYRLFLSDGVLSVQALIGSRLISMIDVDELVVGNIIVLKKFKIRRAKRLNGKGEVVFLGIADCDIVRSETDNQQTEINRRSTSELLGQDQEKETMPTKKVKASSSAVEGSFELKTGSKRKVEHLKSSQDSDSDDFETMTFDDHKLESKRRALHELNSNRSFESQKSMTPTNLNTTSFGSNQQQASFQSPTDNDSAVRSTGHSNSSTKPLHPSTTIVHKQREQATTSTNHTPPAPPTQQPHQHFRPPHPSSHQPPSSLIALPAPPYHTLLSLSSPTLPPKSYPCTLFAVISWTSPTLLAPRPHSPFPLKRHIKIHDPSISSRHSGVTVAVFCDARDFRPRVGTVAVLRGVVMQRTGAGAGEVMLNAYERLKGEVGVGGVVGRWFEDEERVLDAEGWDVKGLREWWGGRAKRKSAGWEERRIVR